MNETFWDAHGVQIGPCPIFKKFVQNLTPRKKSNKRSSGMWGVVGYVGGPLNVWRIHFFLEGTPHEKVDSPGLMGLGGGWRADGGSMGADGVRMRRV